MSQPAVRGDKDSFEVFVLESVHRLPNRCNEGDFVFSKAAVPERHIAS